MTRALLPVLSSLAILAIAFGADTAPDPWKPADLIAPEVLAKAIQDKSAPLILYVGFPVLYRAAHVPGAIFAGPGSKPEGLDALKAALASVPRDRDIVVYCGCCPWDRCPNVRPAFKLIKELGYKNAKLVTIPTNVHTDWVSKGYPVEKSPAETK